MLSSRRNLGAAFAAKFLLFFFQKKIFMDYKMDENKIFFKILLKIKN